MSNAKGYFFSDKNTLTSEVIVILIEVGNELDFELFYYDILIKIQKKNTPK